MIDIMVIIMVSRYHGYHDNPHDHRRHLSVRLLKNDGPGPVGHVVEVLCELCQVQALLLRLSRVAVGDNNCEGEKGDLLLHPGEQLRRVDPLEKLGVEQRHLLGNLVIRVEVAACGWGRSPRRT